MKTNNQVTSQTARERIERNIVRDRKTGHYLVTKYCGYNDKGIQRTTVTCHTLTEARQERDKHEYERKNLGRTSSNTQITVSQCIEQYISERNLEETTKDNYRTRLKVIVCLGALQGMRRGEILGLKWEDITTGTDGSRISIQRERVPVMGATIIEKSPKTKNSRRTIPLQPQTQRALEEYRSIQAELGITGEYIVLSNKGSPISPTHINNMFNRFLKQAGLQHIRLHDLRHTCCTLLIEHNAGFPVVSKYLGHLSSRTTERVYTLCATV